MYSMGLRLIITCNSALVTVVGPPAKMLLFLDSYPIYEHIPILGFHQLLVYQSVVSKTQHHEDASPPGGS